jgi:integrin beta 3
MNHAELDVLTTAFAPAIKEFVAQGFKERDDKIAELSKSLSRALNSIVELTARVSELVLKEGPTGRDGIDGKDGTDGKDGIDGKDGVNGTDGKDGLPGINGMDGIDGRNGVDGIPGEAGMVGPAGRDGVDGVAGAAGAAGERGDPGLAGKDGRDGRDGLPGLNGKDGFGFDTMEKAETETQYGIKFVCGSEVKEFLFDKPQPLPSPTLADWYKGVWRDGSSYKRGDCVSLQGSLFLAKADTSSRPATSPEWQLMVKRGDKGKDGSDGRDGAQGPQGKPGRDLTQIGPDGQQVNRW